MIWILEIGEIMVIKRWIVTLIMLSSFGLAGCLDKSTKNSEDFADKVTELEQQVEEVIKQNVVESEELVKNDLAERTVTVTIMDPNTLEIIRTITPVDLGYETDFEQYKKELEALAKELARGTEAEHGYDQTMVLDKIGEDGQIIKGYPMLILKESELVEKILEASNTGEKVYLPLYLTDSDYKTEEIPFLDDVVVASYTTYFNQSDVGRSKNIELSAKALNNIIVGNGDYFSFNTMVGERTEEKGYQPGPEIINKQLVMGIGGGICQTSSTLFNAVDQTHVRMVERHHHSLNVGYVPKGRDATVSYGTLDFKFRNISGAPFLIKTTYSSEGALVVEITTAKKYEEILKGL